MPPSNKHSDSTPNTPILNAKLTSRGAESSNRKINSVTSIKSSDESQNKLRTPKDEIKKHTRFIPSTPFNDSSHGSTLSLSPIECNYLKKVYATPAPSNELSRVRILLLLILQVKYLIFVIY